MCQQLNTKINFERELEVDNFNNIYLRDIMGEVKDTISPQREKFLARLVNVVYCSGYYGQFDSTDTMSWILTELIPNIEETKISPFKLQIYERDEIVGNEISDITCIPNRNIIVITDDLCDQQDRFWAEIRALKLAILRDKRNIKIILIKLNTTKERNIEQSLGLSGKYLKILEYKTCNEGRNTLFFDKLKYLLE